MPEPKERTNIRVQAERTVLAAVRLPDSSYDQRDPFGELAALAEQAGGQVVGTMDQHLERPVASTYMGSGKVQELRDLCEKLEATMVIFDHELSPRQLANIEEVVGRKILDRSELILDIFASRATTNEAKLQVELAQLEYTYPRLRAMWSHLERIVGAGGIAGIGTRGPGEQQLEIDRRLAQKRRLALQARLLDIQDRRRREVRQRNVDWFTVGIVGYTNAGKSTLFNALTPGGAYADDRLFATLTTRTREWKLATETGQSVPVLLSDTVGFVRDLPHNLVASFRATLEEATHADLLLIVLDVSDPAAELHYDTVVSTLDAIFDEVRLAEKRAGIAKDEPQAFRAPKRLLLLNKADKLADNKEVLIWQSKVPGAIRIEGRNLAHPGHEQLRKVVLTEAQGGAGGVRELLITVPAWDGRTITELERRGQVLERTYSDDGGHATLRVKIGTRPLAQVRAGGAQMQVEEAGGGGAPAQATARPGRARATGRRAGKKKA
jgi:GTP-binding protein HflX